jgi:hypothetical protein
VTAPSGPPVRWLALGLDFSLLAVGGRRTALDLSRSPSYRPSWGLPWMHGTEQTDAWVLCGAPTSFAPGARGRVVVAPFIDLVVEPWHDVHVGDRLRAFEGPKVVGSGDVRWIVGLESPAPQGATLELLQRWADGGPEPAGAAGPV